MEEIPEEDVVEVPPEVGVPILEKLSYVSNEELSNMYVNLLAKASTKHSAEYAHPGFVKIIDRLSPDEAILLKNTQNARSIPFVEVRFKYESKNEWFTQQELATMTKYEANMQYKHNIYTYLCNFQSQGLIDIRRSEWLLPVTIYDPIIERLKPVFAEQAKIFQEGYKLDFPKGKIEVTPLGLLFMRACFKKLNIQHNNTPKKKRLLFKNLFQRKQFQLDLSWM
jgi:Abortive infection alpha